MTSYLTKQISGVVGARCLNRVVDGKKEERQLVLLMFEEEYLTTHVKLRYIRYAVRVFVNEPLQCRNCKRCRHVSSVW